MVKDLAIHVHSGQSSDCRARSQLSESGSFLFIRDGLSMGGKLEHPKVAVAICIIAQSYGDGPQTLFLGPRGPKEGLGGRRTIAKAEGRRTTYDVCLSLQTCAFLL